MRKTLILVSCLSLLLGAAIYLSAQGNSATGEDRLTKLLTVKLNFEKKSFQSVVDAEKRHKEVSGEIIVNVDGLHNWSRRWLESELGLANSRKKRVAAYENHFERMSQVHERVKKNTPSETAFEPVIWAGKYQGRLETGEYYRTEAEILLEQEKAK